MSELYEVATWLVYVLAALTMLAAAVAAILAGLALRLAAEFLRELVGGDREGDTQHTEDAPGQPKNRQPPGEETFGRRSAGPG